MPRPRRRAADSRNQSKRIAFVAFQNIVLLDMVGPWEVFNCANWLTTDGRTPYRLELFSAEGDDRIDAQSGLSLAAHRSLRTFRGDVDTVIVPAAVGVDFTRQNTRDFSRLAARSRRVAGVCGGAFVLAAAGWLDGRKATTHWLVCERLAAQYPQVTVEPNSIFVKDGNVYTSAGVTAGIDLALALVEEDLGREMALNVARHLVVFVRRAGGQTQFSAALESQRAEREPLNDLIAWATDHPSADLSVESLAERASMSVRNFSRVFRREVGTTPGDFVERMRVEAARRKLQDTDLTLERVAEACGLRSGDSMRRVFLRVLKTSPADYRKRFRRPS